MIVEASTGLAGLLITPGLLLIAAGFVLMALRGALRTAAILAIPAAILVLIWTLPDGQVFSLPWLGERLLPLRVDALARLFATVFTVMLFAGGLFALRNPQRLETPAAFVYGGSAIGVVFAGDLVTLFVYWEAMAVASTVIVWLGGADARAAGLRYIVIHLLGGVLLMAGIAGHVAETGSIAFAPLTGAGPATALILLGFLVNAAAWPLSAWLPDAYPRASWSGSVVLSAFTTKTAVYVLIRGFPGDDLLIVAGLVMVVYGLVYALLENDVRKLLSYAIVNQVGFMLVGVGIGGELALNGAAAQAVAHILYKGLLFMAAGSILLTAGLRTRAEIAGLARAMPFTAACLAIGALAMAAVPLTAPFATKGMITDAAGAAHLLLPWLVLTLSGAGVAVVSAILLGLLFGDPPKRRAAPAGEGGDPPASLRAAMGILAALSVLIGVWPAPLYALLPFPVDFQPFTAGHVVAQLQLLLFAGLAFILLRHALRPAAGITLDVDWLWRRPGRMLAADFDRGVGRAWTGFADRSRRGAERLISAVYRAHGPHGILAREWPTGSMTLWAVFLLGAYLLLYYF